MTSTTATRPLPTIPDDVLACAQQDGVADFVIPILDMTRRLFPEAPLTIVYRPDPEVADLHFLCVEVGVPATASVDWLFDAQNRWIEETLAICPPGKAFPFTLHFEFPQP